MAVFYRKAYREPLILRPLPARPRSLAAGWSLRIALLAPMLALVSLGAHAAGIVDTPTFLVLLDCVGLIALFGLLLVFLALRSLWLKGTRGGRQAITALIVTILTLAPYMAAAAAWVSYPRQADVSTDFADPPLRAVELRGGAADHAALVAGGLGDGYPTLAGRRFKAPPDVIEQTLQTVAAKQGWTLVGRRGRIGADDELDYEYAYRIPVLAIPGSVVVRILDEGDTSFVDIRARTDFVSHDLGWNARLIDAFMGDLDFELIGIVDP